MANKELKIDHRRHLAKTLTWRIIASSDTLLIGWFLTGELALGAGIAGLEVLTKSVLYYFHERAWYRWGFGIKHDRK